MKVSSSVVVLWMGVAMGLSLSLNCWSFWVIEIIDSEFVVARRSLSWTMMFNCWLVGVVGGYLCRV